MSLSSVATSPSNSQENLREIELKPALAVIENKDPLPGEGYYEFFSRVGEQTENGWKLNGEIILGDDLQFSIMIAPGYYVGFNRDLPKPRPCMGRVCIDVVVAQNSMGFEVVAHSLQPYQTMEACREDLLFHVSNLKR